jgi:probable HAF family extracellular repeat protein
VGCYNLNYAFVWNKTDGATTLECLEGGLSRATAINDKGQIVGASMAADGKWHAVLWEPVPEPHSFIILISGIVGLTLCRRTRF